MCTIIQVILLVVLYSTRWQKMEIERHGMALFLLTRHKDWRDKKNISIEQIRYCDLRLKWGWHLTWGSEVFFHYGKVDLLWIGGSFNLLQLKKRKITFYLLYSVIYVFAISPPYCCNQLHRSLKGLFSSVNLLQTNLISHLYTSSVHIHHCEY